MTRGILITATTKQHQVAASLLANSIRLSNPELPVALVVDKLDNLHEEVTDDFDHVLEFPFGAFYDVRSNDWQMFWVTPFESNMVIDAHSMVTQNLTSVFDYLEYTHTIAYPTTRYRFNGRINTSVEDFYVQNKMQQVNSGAFYFKKVDESLEFFKICDVIMQQWRDAQLNLVKDKKHHRKTYDSDYVSTLAINCMREPELYMCDSNVFTTVDMSYESKIMLEHEMIGYSWIEKLNYWTTNGKLKIQNYNVQGIVNYHDFDFQTEEIHEHYRQQVKALDKV